MPAFFRLGDILLRADQISAVALNRGESWVKIHLVASPSTIQIHFDDAEKAAEGAAQIEGLLIKNSG